MGQSFKKEKETLDREKTILIKNKKRSISLGDFEFGFDSRRKSSKIESKTKDENEEILLEEDEKSEHIEFDFPESFLDEEEIITEQIRESEYKRIKMEQRENMNKSKSD